MLRQEKLEATDQLTNTIKEIVKQSIKKKHFNTALAAISFMGNYLYEYNQTYTDDELEYFLCEISDLLKEDIENDFGDCDLDTIVFYDGFGLDTRGVALMYLKALGLNGYHVIYITCKKKKNKIPKISNMCRNYNFQMQFLDTYNYLDWIRQLTSVFVNCRPKAAFFYSMPNDVSGIVSFHMFEGLVDRYLIDLTDHAFWLGKSAADYFLGSRNMSAYLQHYERGIPKNKMIKLGVNIAYNCEDDHEKLPFDPLNTRYVFSGGHLYKTLGDPDNRYYKIVESILCKHEDIFFLYAGNGDDTELRKIVSKYPGRAFHVSERKDFYFLIKNCMFYLNTYPMFGGMMMKYCGLAQKLPITLKHNNDSDGLLLHQKECKIEYDNITELLEDVDRLIEDDDYRKCRESLLEGSVITEERFKNNIRDLIENHKTDYEHEFVEIDTSDFRKEFYERFDYNKQMMMIAEFRNIPLLRYFPYTFIKGGIKRLWFELYIRIKNK